MTRRSGDFYDWEGNLIGGRRTVSYSGLVEFQQKEYQAPTYMKGRVVTVLVDNSKQGFVTIACLGERVVSAPERTPLQRWAARAIE